MCGAGIILFWDKRKQFHAIIEFGYWELVFDLKHFNDTTTFRSCRISSSWCLKVLNQQHNLTSANLFISTTSSKVFSIPRKVYCRYWSLQRNTNLSMNIGKPSHTSCKSPQPQFWELLISVPFHWAPNFFTFKTFQFYKLFTKGSLKRKFLSPIKIPWLQIMTIMILTSYAMLNSSLIDWGNSKLIHVCKSGDKRNVVDVPDGRVGYRKVDPREDRILWLCYHQILR